jgi:hypothetical protein
MQRKLLSLVLALTIATISTWVAMGAPALEATTATGVIAYAGLDAQGGAVSIKTVRPNGAEAQTVYTTTEYGHISDIAWKPDASEIAFIDKREQVYSLFNQDIYGIKPDGSNLRRISNPPLFAGLPGSYQTGVVQGALRNNSGRFNVNVISLYIQGATNAAQGAFVNNLDTLTFNFTVADLGAGELQYMVVIWSDLSGGPYREIVPAVVDVTPGQTVNLNTLDFVGQTNQPNISDLSWSHNSALLGVILENGGSGPWQFAAAGQAVGTSLADVALISALALSPSSNQMAYWRLIGGEGVIALNQIGGNASTEQGILRDDVASLNHDRHIAWLPDGSGLVISVNGEIFDYDIASQQVRQLTNFGGGPKVDRVSVSPEGQEIAFSYSPSPGSSDIWILNRQTLQTRALTNDGRSAFPSWSRVDPPASTPTPMPTNTPAPMPTNTPAPGSTPISTPVPPEQLTNRLYLPSITR